MATLSAKTQMRSWACTRCPSDVQTSCKHLLTTHMAHSTQARPRNHLKAIKMCEETLTNTVIPNCVANLSMRASQSYIINPIYIYIHYIYIYRHYIYIYHVCICIYIIRGTGKQLWPRRCQGRWHVPGTHCSMRRALRWANSAKT